MSAMSDHERHISPYDRLLELFFSLKNILPLSLLVPLQFWYCSRCYIKLQMTLSISSTRFTLKHLYFHQGTSKNRCSYLMKDFWCVDAECSRYLGLTSRTSASSWIGAPRPAAAPLSGGSAVSASAWNLQEKTRCFNTEFSYCVKWQPYFQNPIARIESCSPFAFLKEPPNH